MDTSVLLAPCDARRLVLDLWERARRDWPFLSTLLDTAFRREKTPAEDRGLVAEALAEMVRWRRTVGVALDLRDDDGEALLEGALRCSGRVADDVPGTFPAERVARLRAFLDGIASIPGDVERIALAGSLPDWIASLLIAELGAERALDVARAFNRPPPQTLRANTVKAGRDDVLSPWTGLRIPAHPTARSPWGITLETRGDVFSLPAFQEGLVEPQDEASQLVCLLVAPPPGSLVVDACAGAGGKTLGIAAMLRNKGRVVATDVNEGRIEELRRRARRAGLQNVEARQVPADAPADARLAGKADRVLVDAPCTGLGALRRNPEARWRLQPADLQRLPAEQFGIASRALAYVAPRGRLIYATCSFARAEGEDVVEKLLASDPGLERVRAREVVGRAVSDGISDAEGWFLRTWPDRDAMDGFFAAVLRRKG